jgi:hypothetical protein
MKYLALTLASVALVLSVVGCESDPAGTGPHTETFLSAVAMAPEASIIHQGGAHYYGGTKSDTHRMIAVQSTDPDEGSKVRLEMLSSTPQRLHMLVGEFPLVPRHFLGGDNEGKTALYMRDDKLYVAESGTLIVTEATGDILEGRMVGEFEFTAVYWCTPGADRTPCLSMPDEFPVNAERLHITGEFFAGPSPPAKRLIDL